MSITAKRAAFKTLHHQGCFVIPNPWDVGSARYLAHLGFKALATTSSGFAWSHGAPDGAMPLEATLAHLQALAAATDLPVNADFEHGFADDAEGVATNVARACETGISGISIEDSSKRVDAPLFEINEAVSRIRAARAAIDKAGGGVLLTGRAEGFFVGRPDLDDVIARLKAYAAAGADCLYAPGLKTEEQIVAVVKAVAPKPVNVLLPSPAFTVEQLAALGVRRVSLGGALARAAWGEFMRVTGEIAVHGTFERLAQAAPGRDLNTLMEG